MASVEVGVLAGQVLDRRARVVAAPGQGQRERVGDRQRVGREHAGAARAAAHAQRVLRHEQAGIRRGAAVVQQGGHFDRGVEHEAAVGVIDADHELVRHAADRLVEAQLQGAAVAALAPVADVVDRVVFGGDRLAVLVEHAFVAVVLAQHVVVVLAFLEIAAVAVVRARPDLAVEQVERQPRRFAEVEAALRADQVHAVGGFVRRGEDRLPVAREQFGRRGAVAGQVGVGMAEVQVERGAFAAPRQRAVEVLRVRRRQVAPAVLVEAVAHQVPAPAAAVAGGLEGRLGAAERAAVELQASARIAEAGLGLDRDRAAERVEAEHRIGAGEQAHALDRRFRDQVPVDGVAEHLIDAHAVQVHRHALRTAEQRRGGEAAELHVRLQRVVLRAVGRHAGQMAVHEVGQVQRLRAVQRVVVDRLHVVRKLARGDLGAGDRRDADHADEVERGHVLRVRRRRLGGAGVAEQAGQRGGERCEAAAWRGSAQVRHGDFPLCGFVVA